VELGSRSLTETPKKIKYFVDLNSNQSKNNPLKKKKKPAKWSSCIQDVRVFLQGWAT